MKTRPVPALRVDGVRVEEVRETIAMEAPLEIRVNGSPFIVTMRTPGDDRALARGLLHAEAILSEECAVAEYVAETDERTRMVRAIDVRVDPCAVLREFGGERAMLSTSSCGLCGVRDAKRLEMEMPALVVGPDEFLDPSSIPGLFGQLRSGQGAFDTSGGCHAAAAFTMAGEMLALDEDVGRHNAVDKIVGRLVETGSLGRARILLVSGRLSYEIVFKAYRARLAFVLAVSAASSLAVLTGERLGLTIAGFCRDSRATFYSHTGRIVRPPN